MQYNTQKDKLVLSGFGRIVQDMVRHAMTIKDRDERNRCARTIVKTMSAVTGISMRKGEGQQKLWDHLAEIAEYKLDIDYPVEVTPQAERVTRPAPMPYPMKRIRSRQYGSNIEQALMRLATMPPSHKRDQLTARVANQMKRLLTNNQRDTLVEERIANDIRTYTDDNVSLPEGFRFANPSGKNIQGSNALVNPRKKKKPASK